MFSTSEKTALGGLRRAADKTLKQIPHDKTARNDRTLADLSLYSAKLNRWGRPLGATQKRYSSNVSGKLLASGYS